MAVLNSLSVTCAATPIPQDSPNSQSVPSPRQTKILLPKKKPQKWSTGVAPGDYGGPPTTSKIPQVWGGGDKDPLKSYGFMWNKDFEGHFKRMIEEIDSSNEPTPTKVKDEPAGFLSLSRVMSLDSLEMDLSKELSAPTKYELEPKVESNTKSSGTLRSRWKLAPTRREQKKWDRASKNATGGSDEMLREVRRPRGDLEMLAAESREQYIKLKNKLQILTLAIGGVGLLSAYVSYSPEIAASFGAGCLGSLVYIRMLGTSMDSFATGGKGVIKGAIAQPRLLVPVVLVMIYNRWNGILVPEYGFMHLELIPMLVGFFTYKIATFLQAIEDAFAVVAEKTQA